MEIKTVDIRDDVGKIRFEVAKLFGYEVGAIFFQGFQTNNASSYILYLK